MESTLMSILELHGNNENGIPKQSDDLMCFNLSSLKEITIATSPFKTLNVVRNLTRECRLPHLIWNASASDAFLGGRRSSLANFPDLGDAGNHD